MVRIRGLGSVSKRHGSGTLVITVSKNKCIVLPIREQFTQTRYGYSISKPEGVALEAVFGFRDILARIRFPGSVPLTNGSGSGSNSGSDFFLHWFLRMSKKKIFIFFLITCQQAHHLQSKKFNFLLNVCVKILFCRHYFNPLNTSMRKGKDPHLWIRRIRLMDPDLGGPKTCGSCGSGIGIPYTASLGCLAGLCILEWWDELLNRKLVWLLWHRVGNEELWIDQQPVASGLISCVLSSSS